MAEEITEDTSKNGVKAKTVSLWAKVAAGIVVVVAAILKWTGVFKSCDISDICIIGFTVMGMFGTVDVNLALDKFTKKSNE